MNTYYPSARLTVSAVVAVGLLSSSVAVLGSVVGPRAAEAKSVLNGNIRISRQRLMKKCFRSKGYFEANKKGYSCSVRHEDGSATLIVCKNTGKCVGQTDYPENAIPSPVPTRQPRATLPNYKLPESFAKPRQGIAPLRR